jgi:hypothetical protein
MQKIQIISCTIRAGYETVVISISGSGPKLCANDSVADPHHFDSDPDPALHFDADPDPTFYSATDPDPTTHFFPDLDPPMLQITLEGFHLFTLIRIRIMLFTLMRIRIQLPKMMRIRIRICKTR